MLDPADRVALTSLMTDVARAAAAEAQRTAPVPSFRPATVVRGSTAPASATVILDGDTVELTFPCIVPVPASGTRVMVVLTPPSSGLVVGYIDGNAMLPVGVVVPWAAYRSPGGGQTIPYGWLACDGASLPKAQYPALHGVIGVTFGGTVGGSTFNVPDLRGRVVAMVDDGASRTTLGLVGSSGGAQFHTLTTAEMPAHNHQTVANGSNVPGPPFTSLYAIQPGGMQELGIIGSTGGGGQHNNMQPTMALGYLIKA